MRRRPGAQGARARRRRGTAAVAMLIALVVMQVVVAGMVMAGARDQELMEQRVATVRAMYAAEAGMNMALREVVQNVDADGDGGIGTISNDGNSANDPDLSGARVVVTRVNIGDLVVLTSEGRCGSAVRKIQVALE